ncbi:conserved hypothetical protein [Ricinus communis]|uniref:Uncharacterized protein n=1 Tax=Ricinus communis TaxID=3988 RepID=B9S066_RICCO|nr:conserved hypothetical protein [Ricinus communis]
MKMDAEEVKKKRNTGEGNCWIPDERTGIYYPKGQEKVMESIPPKAAKDLGAINWFSHDQDACF